ncbi:MAG: hypothetical protein PHW47_10630 [Lachnospira sp.]|nr:hypothetical protein [Lachnospira sp.]
MFQEKMVTPAIPERVYTLCKIVEKKPITNADLKDRMEPDFLENGTVYYTDYRNAAEELGLITISDDLISLAVDARVLANIENMRAYANLKLEEYNQGQFYTVTRAFFEMGSEILKGEKNVAAMGSLFSQVTKRSVDAMAMRAWRFWVSFLGFGYLQDMFFIPNANAFLWDLISQSSLVKGKRYSTSEFIEGIRPYCNIVINIDPANRKFNYGVSNGLRTLHDAGLIKLEHIMDQKDLWDIYPMNAHPISTTVTNITICK